MMLSPYTLDLVNGAFEAIGAASLYLNVKRLYRDKRVQGVDWRTSFVWTSWGYWNLVYYGGLEQWLSMAAGGLTALANTIWIVMAIHYIRKEKRLDEQRQASASVV